MEMAVVKHGITPHIGAAAPWYHGPPRGLKDGCNIDGAPTGREQSPGDTPSNLGVSFVCYLHLLGTVTHHPYLSRTAL